MVRDGDFLAGGSALFTLHPYVGGRLQVPYCSLGVGQDRRVKTARNGSMSASHMSERDHPAIPVTAHNRCKYYS